MITSAAFGEILPWDSEFFGETVARVHATDRTMLLAADDWCRQEQVSVAYLQLPIDEPALLRAAEQVAFEYVDIRVELSIRSQGPTPAVPSPEHTLATVRLHQASDTEPLERIASSAHRDSRFYADGNFSHERCDALYATWIRRDCTEPGRHVLVAEHEREVAGYLSFHCTEDDDGSPLAVIDLVGVDAAHRGAGLGSALVSSGIAAGMREAGSVSVATQARNLAAQRLYQRAGMTTTATSVWFHKWYR